MLCQRADRISLLGIRIGVAGTDDDRAKAAIIAAVRRLAHEPVRANDLFDLEEEES